MKVQRYPEDFGSSFGVHGDIAIGTDILNNVNSTPSASAPVQFGLRILYSFGFVALLLGAAFYFHTRQPQSAVAAMASGQYGAAARFYETAAQGGDRRASNSLANLYYLGLGVDRDYERASRLYFESASAGVADAQLNLGHMFKQGLGVISDPVRAFAWYNMADIHGSPAAEFYMKQISQEWTLSPLQINTAMTKWPRLPDLINAGLQ